MLKPRIFHTKPIEFVPSSLVSHSLQCDCCYYPFFFIITLSIQEGDTVNKLYFHYRNLPGNILYMRELLGKRRLRVYIYIFTPGNTHDFSLSEKQFRTSPTENQSFKVTTSTTD